MTTNDVTAPTFPKRSGSGRGIPRVIPRVIIPRVIIPRNIPPVIFLVRGFFFLDDDGRRRRLLPVLRFLPTPPPKWDVSRSCTTCNSVVFLASSYNFRKNFSKSSRSFFVVCTSRRWT